MSITMTFDHAHRRLFVKAEGPITLDDIRAHIEEERLGVGLSYRELMDVRGCSPAISPEEARTLPSPSSTRGIQMLPREKVI